MAEHRLPADGPASGAVALGLGSLVAFGRHRGVFKQEVRNRCTEGLADVVEEHAIESFG